MPFRISGLDPAPFRHLYGLAEDELARLGVQRHSVDSHPGFPDRIELRDLEPGESALLLNYVHQPADTPYKASHAIFIREGAETPFEAVDTIPQVIHRRMISLRAFDDRGDMLDADLVDGHAIEPLIARFLSDPRVSYLQAHYAKRGCYAARIARA
ncbi:MAG TPA: DUF1203 domain-containing protein [Rhizomicrobium sp.]|jgi:hypothetical protein